MWCWWCWHPLYSWEDGREAVSLVARGAKPSSALPALLYPSPSPFPSLTPLDPLLPHLLLFAALKQAAGMQTVGLLASPPSWGKLIIFSPHLPSSLLSKSAHLTCHFQWARCFSHVPGGVAHEKVSPRGGDGAHSVLPPCRPSPQSWAPFVMYCCKHWWDLLFRLQNSGLR